MAEYAPTPLVALNSLAAKLSVAWCAARLGFKSVIYLPKGSAPFRVAAMLAGKSVSVHGLLNRLMAFSNR